MYQEKPPVLGLRVDENHFVDCYYEGGSETTWKCFLFNNRFITTERHRGTNKTDEWIAIQSIGGFTSPEEAVSMYSGDIIDGEYNN